MSQLDLKIGPKIKGFRRQLGIQANKLAEKINISPKINSSQISIKTNLKEGILALHHTKR